MSKVRFETVENPNNTTTDIVIIDNEDGSFTSMPKEVYDQLQTQQGVINAN